MVSQSRTQRHGQKQLLSFLITVSFIPNVDVLYVLYHHKDFSNPVSSLDTTLKQSQLLNYLQDKKSCRDLNEQINGFS